MVAYDESVEDFYYGGYAMSLEEMIDELKTKHQALEAAIDEQIHRPHPDDIEIASLKKQKLRIKDEIATITSQ